MLYTQEAAHPSLSLAFISGIFFLSFEAYLGIF